MEKATGKLTENIKGTVNEVAGKFKQQSNDPKIRADGLKQELKGKAQELKGDIQGALGDDI